MATQTSISSIFPQDIAVGNRIDVKFEGICEIQRLRNSSQTQYTYISDRVFVVDEIRNHTQANKDLGTVLVLRDERIQPENHKVGWVISLSDGKVYDIVEWCQPGVMGIVTSVVKL
mgnify:CR=1 FL=1